MMNLQKHPTPKLIPSSLDERSIAIEVYAPRQGIKVDNVAMLYATAIKYQVRGDDQNIQYIKA